MDGKAEPNMISPTAVMDMVSFIFLTTVSVFAEDTTTWALLLVQLKMVMIVKMDRNVVFNKFICKWRV